MKLLGGVLLFVLALVLIFTWAWIDTFDRVFWWGAVSSFMLFMLALCSFVGSFAMLCWAVYCIFNPKG